MESLDKKVVFDNPESASPYIKTKILNCLDGFSQGISNPVPLKEKAIRTIQFQFLTTAMLYTWKFHLSFFLKKECIERTG